MLGDYERVLLPDQLERGNGRHGEPRAGRGAEQVCSRFSSGAARSWEHFRSSLPPAQTGAVGVTCTGITTQPAAAGYGDYLEIANLQRLL